jgi:tmRNA-binding protein
MITPPDVNSVWFPKDTNKEWIYEMTRKNIDIFNMIREDTYHETKRVEEGIGLVSLDDTEIQAIIDGVNLSRSFITMGEDEVSLTGTNITIQALIIEKI